MGKYEGVLLQHLSEQIALEEHLCKTIQDQILEIDGADFEDAKNLLTKTSQALERQFVPLNELLDRLEQEAVSVWTKAVAGNGGSFENHLTQKLINAEKNKRRISRILRDDYSALNFITISNTLLYTTALALNSPEVAALALQHLQNLAAFVVKIGELVPEVVARELHNESPTIDLSVAQTALKNTRQAWRRTP